MKSIVFQVENLEIGGRAEQIVRGGRDKLALLPKGFSGIKQIGVIGWGSQGPAQAQNLRDSLANIESDIKVVVGMRANSDSLDKIRAAGFTEESGTLGEMYEVIGNSDLVILLINDAAQVEEWPNISVAIKPGATLGLSHGFLKGYFDSTGGAVNFADHYSVIAVCPKGMGPSVRRLYEQGKEVNGAGINCSIAVEQDLNGRAADVAIAWAIAIGAPYIFETTLTNEYKSDIFGERGVLLGGVHGMVEALFRYYKENANISNVLAFTFSVEQVTGILSSTISKKGIVGVYNALTTDRDKRDFAKAFRSAYYPYYWLLREIYDEVASGNEIRSVVMAGKRLKEFGKYSWPKVDGTPMWKAGEKARTLRDPNSEVFSTINSTTAGIYCAMMMAQINVLMENGHCLSEICNETVIEAVDSLNPYMRARGVAYMVDNCSTTARLGTRKWGPRFDHITMQQVLPALEDGEPVDDIWFQAFLDHAIHNALATCETMRPTVDIAVV